MGWMVHEKGNRKLVNTGRETGSRKIYNASDFFLKGCRDKNICKKSVTGLFLNVILLPLVFLVMILLCSVLNQEELLY